MFDFFSGTLHTKTPARIVVDVGGVGYELTVPVSTYEKLPETGSAVHVLAYFHVTESHQHLFGFQTEEERALFRMLIAISGIGPKIALSILSGVGGKEFRRAVICGDLDALTQISGIGRKTAERLVVELREKIVLEGGTERELTEGASAVGSVAQDSVSALMGLGYRRHEAGAAVEKVFQTLMTKRASLSVEEVIKASLKLL